MRVLSFFAGNFPSVVLGIVLGLAQAAPSFAAPDKQYFSDMLNTMCMIGDCSERPNPHTEQGAEEILAGAVVLSYYGAQNRLDEFNKPLKGMGLENGWLIPAEQVEEAVCRYYGFTQSQYGELVKAAEKKQLTNGFYFLGAGDPGIVDYKVEKVEPLKNGLIRVSGIEDTGEASKFKAFFKKASCGNREHWVLLRLVDENLPEESEDYVLPEDK